VTGTGTGRPLADINRLIRENRVDDYPSANRDLGMQPLRFAEGESRWRWAQQPGRVLNPFGTVQGGYLAVFVDELLATAVGSVLEEGEWAMTADTRLSYLRAVPPGEIEGGARVLRRSRSLAFLEAGVTDARGRAVVTAASTWSISRQRDEH